MRVAIYGSRVHLHETSLSKIFVSSNLLRLYNVWFKVRFGSGLKYAGDITVVVKPVFQCIVFVLFSEY